MFDRVSRHDAGLWNGRDRARSTTPCARDGDELTGMRSRYLERMRSASALRFSKGCSSLNLDRMAGIVADVCCVVSFEGRESRGAVAVEENAKGVLIRCGVACLCCLLRRCCQQASGVGTLARNVVWTAVKGTNRTLEARCEGGCLLVMPVKWSVEVKVMEWSQAVGGF